MAQVTADGARRQPLDEGDDNARPCVIKKEGNYEVDG